MAKFQVKSDCAAMNLCSLRRLGEEIGPQAVWWGEAAGKETGCEAREGVRRGKW